MKPLYTALLISMMMSWTIFGQDLSNLKSSKPFAIHGNLTTSLNHYGTTNTLQSYQPLSYLVSINLTPSVYGFSMPFSFTYSKMNRSFNHPFYRFGLSPTYKWMKLDLGHRSTSFSKYSVSGQKSVGAGITLTPGKFRVGFMYGKFWRDRGFRTTNNAEFDQDDFTRNGFAGKIGVGSQKNFVDLVLMKIADDVDDFRDTTGNISPESNVIASAVSKFSFGKHVKLHAEVAASIFTRDLNADAYDLDDLEDILRKGAEFTQVNNSSSLSWAKDIGLDFNIKKFTLGLLYQRIDPEYKSLGANFIRNDFENYSLKTSYKFKKVYFNGSVGLLKDNLKNTKAKQTNRIVSRINITLNPLKAFRLSVNYSNFSTQQKEGRLPLNDTIRLYQVNKNFSVIPQLSFTGKNSTHTVVANYSLANMTDKNEFATSLTPVVSNVAFVQYAYRSNLGGWGASANINYTNFKTDFSEVTNIGPTLSFDKSLFDKKANATLGMTFMSSDNNQVKGTILSFRTGFNYKITKRQNLRFSYYFTKSQYPDSSTVKDYSNSRGILAYSYQL